MGGIYSLLHLNKWTGICWDWDWDPLRVLANKVCTVKIKTCAYRKSNFKSILNFSLIVALIF